MQNFQKFGIHNYILVFEAEQIYLTLQVPHSKPSIPNPRHQIHPVPYSLFPSPNPKNLALNAEPYPLKYRWKLLWEKYGLFKFATKYTLYPNP